jgi:hypothetical protein
VGRRACRRSERSAVLGGDLPEGVEHRRAAPTGLGDRLGHEPTGELVLALRQGDGDVSGRTSVELGRSAGTRPAAAGEPSELDVEQPVVREPIEVELRLVERDVERSGRLVPGHRMVLGAHVEVEVAAQRVGQRADACRPFEEVAHRAVRSKKHIA